MMAQSKSPRADEAGSAKDVDDSSSRATMSTPVGPVTVTSNGRAIVGIEWPDIGADTGSGTNAGTGADTDQSADPSDTLVVEGLRQLRAYFDGGLTHYDLPVDLGGISDVARTVLTTLEETVESGTTITYGELAARSGTGIPARAIGSIMGLNPVPLIIPCHRVVASDSLGGYSGGPRGQELETKRWLLEFEEALPRPLF